MKKKILIQGFRVHDVGYRLTLCQYAQIFRIFSFEAINETIHSQERVIIYAEGDEEKLSEFVAYIKARQPPSAEVSSITHEDFEGEILPLAVFSQSLQMEQMAKAVPILVEMRDMQMNSITLQKETLCLQHETIDLQKETIHLQRETIGLQHNTLKKQDEMIDEMRMMREDVVSLIKIRLDNVERTLADMKRAFDSMGVHLEP